MGLALGPAAALDATPSRPCGRLGPCPLKHAIIASRTATRLQRRGLSQQRPRWTALASASLAAEPRHLGDHSTHHRQSEPLTWHALAPGVPAGRVRAHFSFRYSGTARPCIAGDAPALGAWMPTSAVRMEPCGGDLWAATVDLPAGVTVQYKYVLVDGAGHTVQWQDGPNLALSLPRDPSASVARADAWSGAAMVTSAAAAAADTMQGVVLAASQSQPYSAFPQTHVAAGAAAVAPPPGSPNIGRAIAPAAARAALPSLRHQLEAALAALSTPYDTATSGAFVDSSTGHSPDAESVGVAMEGLRALQAIALEYDGGAAPRPGDMEHLRHAFSPSACGDDDCAGLNDADATSASAHFAGVGGVDGCEAAAAAAASSDPLVAALLSDDCDLCCAFLHDALAGSLGTSSALSSADYSNNGSGSPTAITSSANSVLHNPTAC